jgi:hypothetical protein
MAGFLLAVLVEPELVELALVELEPLEPALRLIPAAAASCITAETDFPNCDAI